MRKFDDFKINLVGLCFSDLWRFKKKSCNLFCSTNILTKFTIQKLRKLYLVISSGTHLKRIRGDTVKRPGISRPLTTIFLLSILGLYSTRIFCFMCFVHSLQNYKYFRKTCIFPCWIHRTFLQSVWFHCTEC